MAVALVLFSLPGNEDPIRKLLYRSFRGTPTEEQRRRGREELARKLNSFDYRGEPLPAQLQLSEELPVVELL